MTNADVPAPVDVNCPNCGAVSRSFRKQCWMCRGPLSGSGIDPSRPPPRPAGVRPQGDGWWRMSLFSAVVLLLAFLGMLLAWPGYAIVFGCVMAPLVFAVLNAARPDARATETRRSFAAVGSVLLFSVVALPVLCFAAIAVLFVVVCTPMLGH